MLHYILQRLHIPPDDLYKKPIMIRKFIESSMQVQIEAEAKVAEEIKNRQGAR